MNDRKIKAEVISNNLMRPIIVEFRIAAETMSREDFLEHVKAIVLEQAISKLKRDLIIKSITSYDELI